MTTRKGSFNVQVIRIIAFFMVTLVSFKVTAALPPTDTPPSYSKHQEIRTINSRMIEAFEEELKQPLTLEQRRQLDSFATQVVTEESHLETQLVSKDNGEQTVITVLFCLKAKFGAIMRLGTGVCSTTNGEIHYLSAFGSGASFGVAAGGAVIIHWGNERQSLSGTYTGASFGSIRFKSLIKGIELSAKGLLKTIGGEVGYYTGGSGDILMGGLSVGPMVDLSVTALELD